MISITITGDTPELIAAHVAWVAHRLGSVDIVEEVIERKEKKASKAAEKAIEKASAAPSEPPAAAEPAPQPTVPDLMALASAKSKLVGVEKVKDTIASFGAKTIKELPLEKRTDLQAALEALQA